MAGVFSLLDRSSKMVDGYGTAGASGDGASTGSAPELTPYQKYLDSLRFLGVIKEVMPSFEVFGPRSFTDVVAEVKRRVSYKFWSSQGDHGLSIEDAVSVATLSLLEYWIPRFAGEDHERNYRFALTYAVHRASDHLLNEIGYSLGKLSLDELTDPAGNTEGDADSSCSRKPGLLADPAPTPEELACSDAVVADVRRLVDELDWNACLSDESTRQEARRTGRSQMTVARNRKRARTCVRAAYLSAI